METFLLTCLQAQFLVTRVQSNPILTVPQKSSLVREIKQVTKKGCFLDANADGRNAL